MAEVDWPILNGVGLKTRWASIGWYNGYSSQDLAHFDLSVSRGNHIEEAPLPGGALTFILQYYCKGFIT